MPNEDLENVSPEVASPVGDAAPVAVDEGVPQTVEVESSKPEEDSGLSLAGLNADVLRELEASRAALEALRGEHAALLRETKNLIFSGGAILPREGQSETTNSGATQEVASPNATSAPGPTPLLSNDQLRALMKSN